jgi:hypothetical protein
VFGSNNARLIQIFMNRFEPEGDHFVFRANLRAPGIQVTAAERDRFIAAYVRNVRVAYWGMLAAVVLVMIGTVVVLFPQLGNLPTFAIAAPLVVLVVGYVALTFWLARAPVRALQGRAAAEPGRTQDEARRIAFRRMTWSQMGIAVAFLAFGLWRISLRNNLLVGWNRLWLAFFGLLLVLVAVQAVRKWRFDRQDAGRDAGTPGPTVS